MCVQNSSSWTCGVCETVNCHNETSRCELCGEPETGSMEAQVFASRSWWRHLIETFFVLHSINGINTSARMHSAVFQLSVWRANVCLWSDRLCSGEKYMMIYRREWNKSVGGLRLFTTECLGMWAKRIWVHNRIELISWELGKHHLILTRYTCPAGAHMPVRAFHVDGVRSHCTHALSVRCARRNRASDNGRLLFNVREVVSNNFSKFF